ALALATASSASTRAALAASSMRFARSTTSTACSAAMSLWRSSGVVVTGPIIPHRYGRALLNHRVSQSVAAPDQVSGRLSARHLWTPGANRVPPVDPVEHVG